MLCIRQGNKYLGITHAGKPEFQIAPTQLVQFVNTTSIKSFMRDNFPNVKGEIEVFEEVGTTIMRITL